ncbi:MAG TPA: ABC transporter permease [Acidimicrobiia bacterium]|nr:ABC transporter permease [Acidimicrobiia bacterium]
MTIDSIRVALRGMLANRMRSLLTMLGILIGTAAVILLVAVGTGISNLVQHQIETLGSNAVYVFPQQSRGGQDRGGTNARRIRLTQTDVDALSDRTNAPSIINVAPTVQTNATAVAEGTTYALQNLIGATPNYMEVRNATLQAGRHFDESDMANYAKVAVMGQTVADGLFGKGSNPVGQQVSFNGVRFRIIGLLEKKGSSGIGDQDDVVIAPLNTVRATLVGNVDSYTLIAIQAASREVTDSAQAEAIRILRGTHKLGPGQPLDFQIFNQASLLKTGQQAALVFSLLLAAVAAISLFVGGIGVMNIMLVTVTERTREIGIRKALGAQRIDILSQFLTEAVLLALIGGALGVSVGVGFAQLQVGPLEPVVSPGSIVVSFVVSAMVGVFFGAYPANRAAKLTPIEALRYE